MAKRIEEPGELFNELTVAVNSNDDLNIVKKIEVVPVPDGTAYCYSTPTFFIGNALMSLEVFPNQVYLHNHRDEVLTVSGLIKITGPGEQFSFGRETIQPFSFRSCLDVGVKGASLTKLEITLTLHTKENASDNGWIR